MNVLPTVVWILKFGSGLVSSAFWTFLKYQQGMNIPTKLVNQIANFG
jgi:hypothetical protein